MYKYIRIATIALGILLAASSASAQVQPCPTGTLANVLNTSCSVGSLIVNFGDITTGTATAIGFIPVQSATQPGFKLITNFIDGPATGTNFHLLQFRYTVQATPGFEINSSNLSMDATIQQGNPLDLVFSEISDFQNFENAGFVVTSTALDIENGVTLSNILTDNEILPVPSFLSDGKIGGDPFTTQLVNLTSGSTSASLNSATFVFALGPIIAAPRLAPVSYTNIDLPNIPTTEAAGINNAGQIVGAYFDAQGVEHGYVTKADGGFTTIDFPGATSTNCLGINNHGGHHWILY